MSWILWLITGTLGETGLKSTEEMSAVHQVSKSNTTTMSSLTGIFAINFKIKIL